MDCTVSLSTTMSLILLSVGLIFVFLPSLCLQSLATIDTGEVNSYNGLMLLLARLIGGMSLVFSITMILLVSFSKNKEESESANYQSQQKFRISISRISLSCYALFGIIIILVGIISDRLGENHPTSGGSNNLIINYIYLWGTGVLFLSFSCLGLIISFWSERNIPGEFRELSNGTQPVSPAYSCFPCCGRRRSLQDQAQSVQNNNDQSEIMAEQTDLTEPLLLEGENLNHDHSSDESREDVQIEDNDNNNNNSRIQGTRRLIKLAAPQMSYLYIGCIVLLIRLPFSLSIPHFVSTTLGALSRADYSQARTEILLLFLLGTVDAILDFWCVFLFGYAKERIVRGVRVDLLAAILRQDISFFDRNASGDLSSRLSSDCGEMAGDLTWFFRFSIESVVRITGIAGYMMFRCPTLGGCALSIVPFVGVLNKLYGDWLAKNSVQVQTALAKANSVAQETFACVRTVIAFAAEDFEHEKYVTRINEHYRLNIRQLIMTGIYYMGISTFLINTVVQALLLLIGAHLIQEGRLSSEVLLAFMLYQGGLQNETMNLFNSYSSLIKSSGAGDKVFRLLDRVPPPPGTGNHEVAAQSRTMYIEGGNNDENETTAFPIFIRNVQFFYPTRPQHLVLKGLNLKIEPGLVTALVGTSGCGKSTIVSLLQRFYDPVSGNLFMDDQNFKYMNLKEHRKHIGVVTQDPVLFSGTILSNINYGCPTATIEDAIEAAKLANAHKFITSFPDGYNTQVGERGIQLSGGQKQRIAIARAVAKNPTLLLLDEATSALDAESETVVQEALDKLLVTTKMTTVVVAHRLRTVRNADCITYLDQGQVVEQGTHDELMQLNDGLYRSMVQRSGTNGKLCEM